MTSTLLKSTVSSTTTDYIPGVSSWVSGTSTFDHAGLKNTDEQTDGSGDIAASRQYDAFGKVVCSHQTWTEPFGYGGAYGYQTDGDHGLMLLGHRYYETDTGRFLTRDPIKDGRNWYGYCDGIQGAGRPAHYKVQVTAVRPPGDLAGVTTLARSSA
ncbi:MAG TPA: RHS repeat-associated core domain-containing protein [Fimbriimonadaceae bacterium]|nr:RHS repeat-associated core domain-containing protein [Fimbriimonadaceae bacterium]HRJ96066.1 RHS repeat-associated core domain-containing protein [Fimbriimonadaceae bacterium]